MYPMKARGHRKIIFQNRQKCSPEHVFILFFFVFLFFFFFFLNGIPPKKMVTEKFSNMLYRLKFFENTQFAIIAWTEENGNFRESQPTV